MRKIFAIGDIHGCYENLCRMIERIDFDRQRDTLVMMGDYIDRGPESFEVVQYLADLKAGLPHMILLKGNHEEMLENYLSGEATLPYLLNGGIQTLRSYQTHRENRFAPLIPLRHREFFASLCLYYETDDYVFVHAGLRDNVPLAHQKTEDLLWIRDAFIRSDYDFGKRVIFGHTPFSEPLVLPNKIGIDTGAVYGNKLTCLELPTCKFHFS